MYANVFFDTVGCFVVVVGATAAWAESFIKDWKPQCIRNSISNLRHKFMVINYKISRRLILSLNRIERRETGRNWHLGATSLLPYFWAINLTIRKKRENNTRVSRTFHVRHVNFHGSAKHRPQRNWTSRNSIFGMTESGAILILSFRAGYRNEFVRGVQFFFISYRNEIKFRAGRKMMWNLPDANIIV